MAENVATTLGVTMKQRYCYPNTPEDVVPEGEVIFRSDDQGNLIYGENHGLDMAKGVINNVWGQTTLIQTLKGTTYAGRRMFWFDTTDPIDLGLRHAEGPDVRVREAVTLGHEPVDIPVDSLGTETKTSAWSPRGVGAGNVKAKRPSMNDLKLGSLTYGLRLNEGRELGAGGHKLLGALGYEAQVSAGVTVGSQPISVKVEGIEFKQLPDKGSFVAADGTVIDYMQKVSTGKPDDPLQGELRGCTTDSDPVTLAPGDELWLRVELKPGDLLILAVNPDPQNGARYTGCRKGQSVGRLLWEATLTPDGGILAADASPGLTGAFAGISAQPAEDLYWSRRGGEFWIFTTPLGTKNPKDRVFVRSHGQLDPRSGIGLGPTLRLANPGPVLQATIKEDGVIIESRSRLLVANTAAADVQAISLEGTIEGQVVTVRALDGNTRFVHNHANLPGRLWLVTRGSFAAQQDDLLRFQREGQVWRQE